MLQRYFKGLYQQTMESAYGLARSEIHQIAVNGGQILDCGAASGHSFGQLNRLGPIPPDCYHGIEWHPDLVEAGQRSGLDIVQGDLNRPLPFDSDRFDCVYGLSLLEHLLNGCRFIRESHRVLKPGGKLVLLTPNISTYFTAALILAGKMPSSGPHPDSDALLLSEELFVVRHPSLVQDTEADTPVHRHLVVFSYRVLRKFLGMAGFSRVEGHGFGLYPFPRFMQSTLQRIDPYHCHQMVFVATK